MSRGRCLAIAFPGCLAASTCCLLLATCLPRRIKDGLGGVATLIGAVDVFLAFCMVAVWFVLLRQRSPGRANYEHAVLISASLIALVFIGVWWTPDGADQTILLPGPAWRSFVVIGALPSVLAQLNVASDPLQDEGVV